MLPPFNFKRQSQLALAVAQRQPFILLITSTGRTWAMDAGQIYNPDSGRLVKRDGDVGRRLLATYGEAAMVDYTRRRTADKNATKPTPLASGVAVKPAAQSAIVRPTTGVGPVMPIPSVPPAGATEAVWRGYLEQVLRPKSGDQLAELARIGVFTPAQWERFFRLDQLPLCLARGETARLLSHEYNLARA